MFRATRDLSLTGGKAALLCTFFGALRRRLALVLKIVSGDTVPVENMLTGGLERRVAAVSDVEIPDSLKHVEKAVTDRSPGAHPLTGPIYVEGPNRETCWRCTLLASSSYASGEETALRRIKTSGCDMLRTQSMSQMEILGFTFWGLESSAAPMP
jgi:hypothetical protein